MNIIPNEKHHDAGVEQYFWAVNDLSFLLYFVFFPFSHSSNQGCSQFTAYKREGIMMGSTWLISLFSFPKAPSLNITQEGNTVKLESVLYSLSVEGWNLKRRLWEQRPGNYGEKHQVLSPWVNLPEAGEEMLYTALRKIGWRKLPKWPQPYAAEKYQDIQWCREESERTHRSLVW